MPKKKEQETTTDPKASVPSSLVPSSPAPDDKPTLPVLKVDMEEIILSVETIKKYLCPDATNEEMELFGHTCRMWNLNPFKREIYLVKYSKTQPASTVIGYETFLKRADRTGKLTGWKAWTDGVPGTPGFKAVVEIHRKDWTFPFVHEVYYDEYVQKKDGQPNAFWKRARTQTKKVVIGQGFRMCFPDELGGMPYLAEEILNAEVIDITLIKQDKTGGGAQPDESPEQLKPRLGQEKAEAPAGPSPLPPPPTPKAKPPEPPKPRPVPVPATPRPVSRPATPPPAKSAPPSGEATSPGRDDGPLDEELPQVLDTAGGDGQEPADDGVASADGEMWDEQIRQCIRYLIDRCGRSADALFGIILKRIKEKFKKEVSEITGPELDDEQKQWLVELLKKTIAADEAKTKAGTK